jgi:DNA-damage-inducible protein D
VEKDLKGEQPISKEHIANNLAVRKILKERGVNPESLPASEDIKKVKRRLEGEKKKLSKKMPAKRRK